MAELSETAVNIFSIIRLIIAITKRAVKFASNFLSGHISTTRGSQIPLNGNRKSMLSRRHVPREEYDAIQDDVGKLAPTWG